MQILSELWGQTKKLKELFSSLYFLFTYARPNLQFRHSLVSKYSSHPMFYQHAQQLEEEGIVILPAYFSGDILKQMQMDFEKWAPQEPTEKPHKEVYRLKRECLENSIELSSAAVDPYLNDLVAYYWGKPIYLAEVSGRRLEPCEPYEYGAFQWHHDCKRKQIKVFIFLNEVPEDGQVMHYIPKTHKIVHWDLNYDKSRYSHGKIESWFKKYSPPLNCSCPAGTVAIFDTNGLHRGNRNFGPRRDSWTFNFNGGNRRQFQPIPNLHPEVLARLNKDQKRRVRAH